MTRRWFIRTFFICLLLLSIGAWVVGLQRDWIVGYGGKSSWDVSCAWGKIDIKWMANENIPARRGWFADSDQARIPMDLRASRLGFYVAFGEYIKCLSIPFWFPSSLSAAFLFLAWRKTRPTLDPKSAFPIETITTIDHRTTDPTTDN